MTTALTPAEATVLTLLANGLPVADLAAELHVLPRTIYTHRARALKKLGAGSVDQAVAVAHRTGEILPGDIVNATARQLAYRAAAAEAEVVRLRRELAAEQAHGTREMTAAVAAEAKLAALVPIFEGFERLLVTSSRDWGEYRVDAWLYAVIVGWDCKKTEHDETCVHGALEEAAEQHGWDAEAVTKARRYRDVVRSILDGQP